MAHLKSAIFLLGLLFLCGLVRAQLDTTIGSTDPMTDPISFKFADEDAAGAPADVESSYDNAPIPEAESFWSQSNNNVDLQSPEIDSFAASPVFTDSAPNGDDNAVIFDDATAYGGNTTVDEDGFDMVEDLDSTSIAAE